MLAGRGTRMVRHWMPRRLAQSFATANTPLAAAVAQAAATSPAPSLETAPLSSELNQLVDRLCNLSLIQTAQVVAVLKKRLNLPDILAAPQVTASGTGAGKAAEADEPAVAAAEKTEFRVTLEKFDPSSKAKVIREIKALLPQLNLVEAKSFVESAPKMIKEKIKKDEAEKIKKTLEDLGATISLD